MTFQRIGEIQRNKMKTHAGVIGGGGGKENRSDQQVVRWLFFHLREKNARKIQNITFKWKSFQFHCLTRLLNGG